jgi:hypothetical protein
MAVTLADLDTPFATLGRACVRRLKKHLADLRGPLRLQVKFRFSTGVSRKSVGEVDGG